jgi:hypothetical protein
VIVAGVAVVVPAAVCWGNATTAVKKKENRAMTWRKSILAVFELTGTERKKLSGWFVNTVRGAADLRNPGSRAKLGVYITATGLTTDSSFLEHSKFEKKPSLQVSHIRVPSISGAVSDSSKERQRVQLSS